MEKKRLPPLSDWCSTRVVHDRTTEPWPLIIINGDAMNPIDMAHINNCFQGDKVQVCNVPGSVWASVSTTAARTKAISEIVSKIESYLTSPGILVCLTSAGLKLGFRYAIRNPSHIITMIIINPEPRVLRELQSLASEISALNLKPKRTCHLLLVVNETTKAIDRAEIIAAQVAICNATEWRSIPLVVVSQDKKTVVSQLVEALPILYTRISTRTPEIKLPELDNPRENKKRKRVREELPQEQQKQPTSSSSASSLSSSQKSPQPQSEEKKYIVPDSTPNWIISDVVDVTSTVLWRAMRVPPVLGYDIVSTIAAMLPEKLDKQIEIEISFGTLTTGSRRTQPTMTRQSPNIRAGPISSSSGSIMSYSSGTRVDGPSSSSQSSERFSSGCCHAMAIDRKDSTFFRSGIPDRFMFTTLCARLRRACETINNPRLVYEKPVDEGFDHIFTIPISELVVSHPGLIPNGKGTIQLRIENRPGGPRNGVAIYKQKQQQLDVSCSGVKTSALDWRLRISREIAFDISKISSARLASVKRIRHKKRYSFVFGNWSFDLTEVMNETPRDGDRFSPSTRSGVGSSEISKLHGILQPTTYEFEIEYIELSRDSSESTMAVNRLSLANQITDFAKLGTVLAQWTGAIT